MVNNELLFIVIVSVGGKDFYQHFGVEDAVNHAVFLCDFAAPAVCGLTFQRFGMAGACLGMLGKFLEKTAGFSEGFWLAMGKALQMLRCFGRNYNIIFHSHFSLKKPSNPLQEA